MYHTQDMSDKNYFEFFGLPVSYNLDETALMYIYLERQRKEHPDFCTGDCVSIFADNSVAELNTAYQTLMDPINRAEHYLRVRGVSILDQLPSDFAEEMFNMHQKYDSIKNKSEKEKFLESLRNRMEDILSLLHTLKEDDLKKFRKYTCLLRFINSFLEKVELNAYSRD